MPLRFGALSLALGLYGLLGSPTPDQPGMVEAIIGGLLVFAALPDMLRQAPICLTMRGPKWVLGGWAFFLYALTIPLAIALVQDHDSANVIRDFVFVLFFLLPLWLSPLVSKNPRFLGAAMVWIGLAFSVRTILPGLNAALPGVDVSAPLYLAIAPTVLFAAFYLAGRALDRAWHGGIRSGAFLRAGLLIGLCSAPCLALALTLQRISLVALAGCVVLWTAILLCRAPRRALLPIAMMGAGLFAGAEMLFQTIEAISLKTAIVGVNSRLDEAALAIETLSGDLFTVLFGRGWGATIPSPATAGIPVNFTHSLITMVWMKTGLSGLILAGTYVTGIVARVVSRIQADPVLTLALLFPIAIDLFLYASYKSLDFGLILLMASTFQVGGEPRTARTYKTPSTVEPTKVVRA